MKDYEYMTVQQVVDDKKFPFTIGQMRTFLMNRELNGLNISVRKIGKRIFFRKDLLENWIEKYIEEED